MIYYGHFSPMPVRFDPPRAGTMPERRQPVAAGLAEVDEARARRSGQGTGLIIRTMTADECRRNGAKAVRRKKIPLKGEKP